MRQSGVLIKTESRLFWENKKRTTAFKAVVLVKSVQKLFDGLFGNINIRDDKKLERYTVA